MSSVISQTNLPNVEIQSIAQELSAAWGVEFGIWRFAEQWTQWKSELQLSDELSKVLFDVVGSRSATSKTLACGQTIIVVPVGNIGTPVLAVAKIAPNPELLLEVATRLTESMAVQRQQIDIQSTQINSYASQVTMDFEELTWLRSVAETVELHDDRNSVADAAFDILPSLREMTCAESIVLMAADDSHDDCRVGKLTFREGRKLLTDEQCRSIVGQCQEECTSRPVVRNCRNGKGLFDVPTVNSVIIIKVATASFHYGWLFLSNKLAGDRFVEVEDEFSQTHIDPFNACEFGTYEAGLATTAASVLAAYARNASLFNDYKELLTGTIRSLVNAIDAKDSYTCGHSDRVALLSRRLAAAIGFDSQKCHRIYMSGLLHDVGKIGVPDVVLNKAGKLTDEEFDQIKQHPVIGHEILRHVKNLNYVLPGVLHHHESIDGRGYPHGLKGDDIPLEARIIAVADAYDAMTSDRAYRAGMPTEKAESILKDGAGQQWDAELIKAFFRVIEDIRAICDKDRVMRNPEAMLDHASI